MAKPIYDPFSWNAPGNTLQDLYNWYLSGEDEATDDTGGGGGDPAAGGENYSVLRPDPSTVRLPTGSPYPDITFDGPLTQEQLADYRFQQNRADAGAGYYEDPNYIGGFSGNITQTGPGRQFMYDDTGDEYDDIHLYGGPEEDASWFKQLREGFSDNPLMQGVMAIASPFTTIAKGFAQALPVNERAIMEQQGLQQGLALDDIGRVVAQDFGYVDGKHKALGRSDPRNIFAGLNYHLIDQDTVKKMKDRIEKGMKEGPEKRKRLKALDQAWANKQLVDEATADLVDKKTREKGLTPMSDQIAINKAKEDMQQKIKDADRLDILKADEDLLNLVGSVPPTDEIKVADLPTLSKTNIEKAIIGMPEHLTSDIERERNRQLIELAKEEEKKEFLIKEKKKKDLDFLTKTSLEQMIEAESGVLDLPEPGSTSLTDQIAINKAKEDMQQKIKAAEKYLGPKTYDFDYGQARREGRRKDKPGGFTDPGKRSYGPHYSGGGIVDLL